MNSDKKESIAITAIINEVNQFDNLQESLRKSDKEPVWDGELRLYKAESNKSDEIIGRIPVQVKGTEGDGHNTKDTLNYKVKISDIENYKKDKKGAIFFVVEVFENRQTKIYYKMFDLKTIDEILNSKKPKQSTKSVQFKKLEKNKLASICIDFMKNLNIYESIVPVPKVEVYDKKTICYDDNTKYELEEMKKANEVFFETNAYREAKKKLDQQNIIILHGEPWVGKTSTARKLVMAYIDQGYLFLYGNVDDLVEIKNKVAMEGKMICLLDDFLGSNVQYLEKNVAESTLDKIINIFKNSKEKKLILTTRTYIYNNGKQLFYKFHNATKIEDEYLIDVKDYNYLEKGSILYNHLKKNDLLGTVQYEQILDKQFYEDIIENENFNPGVISLICEKMKDKNITNVKEYIREVLKDPEKLWDDEYRKLTIYEKIILNIIVLFGVKVPESYVKEQFDQIIKNENIKLLEADTFYKSIETLTLSFIKVTFNEEDERELDVCKHSISDYIISRVRKEQINIKWYIKSAKYVEVLNYIDIIIDDDQEWIREEVAKKVEKDLDKIESFFYDRIHVLYGILKRNINSKREKILKQVILNAFENYNIGLVLSILEDEDDFLYEFSLEMFKKYIIDANDEEYLYRINYVSEYETYIKTCLEILNYQKNSEYIMVNLEDIKDSLIDVISEDVENTINEIVMKSVAEDIIKGETLKQIEDEYIDASVNDEIPSLSKACDRHTYKTILEFLHDCCYIYVDKQELQEEVKRLKNSLKKAKNHYIKETLIEEELAQKRYIQEKFNKHIENQELLKGKVKTEIIIDYEKFASDVSYKEYDKWWINSFADDYIDYLHNCQDYTSLVLYYEFTHQEFEVDYSLGGLAKQFLEYIYEKYGITKKADKVLKEIAYNNFINGYTSIKASEIEKYETKYPKEMKKLYEANLIVKKKQKYYFINKYIYFYIALKEIDKKNDDLLLTIVNWMEKEFDIEDESLIEKRQNIFRLCSEIDRVKFNKKYVIPALSSFICMIETKCRSKGKMEISRAIINMISPEIELDFKFDFVSNLNCIYPFSWIVHFVTGIELEWEVGLLDYAIYQKQLYEKCYDEKEDVYILKFKEMLKDKELKDICSEVGVFDYLYDIYSACVETLLEIFENPSIDTYNIKNKELREKYDIF